MPDETDPTPHEHKHHHHKDKIDPDAPVAPETLNSPTAPTWMTNPPGPATHIPVETDEEQEETGGE